MPYRPGAGPQRLSDLVSIEDVYRSENVFINNVAAATHEPPFTVEGGVNIPIDTYVFDQFHADPLLSAAGLNAPFDDENAFDGGNFDGAALYPNATASLPAEVLGQSEDLPPGRVPSGVPVSCGAFQISPLDYDQNLSPNYTIRNLSVGAVFPHRIDAQAGLTVQDILCNMQALAVNILEPLRAKYPGFNINSAFRRGAGTSQHNRGQAVDLQWPGKPPADYNEIAVWCITNLPFDQFIFEHGNSIWLHISYNRQINRQRNIILTYYPRISPNYQAGLTNYFAPTTPFPPPENGNNTG